MAIINLIVLWKIVLENSYCELHFSVLLRRRAFHAGNKCTACQTQSRMEKFVHESSVARNCLRKTAKVLTIKDAVCRSPFHSFPSSHVLIGSLVFIFLFN